VKKSGRRAKTKGNEGEKDRQLEQFVAKVCHKGKLSRRKRPNTERLYNTNRKRPKEKKEKEG